MACQPAPDLDLEPAGLKVELIVHHHETFYVLDAITPHQQTNRLAAAIHEGLRKGDRNAAVAHSQFIAVSSLARRL